MGQMKHLISTAQANVNEVVMHDTVLDGLGV